MAKTGTGIYRFRISLRDIEPEIWRQIEVPGSYSFWDLHVAIQDAMGWLDYHLHEFIPAGTPAAPAESIGIPDGPHDEEVAAGWEEPLSRYFSTPGDTAMYLYDFGDDWLHEVRLVALEPRARGVKYPRCTDGARACPPEDCGGVAGYYDLCEILQAPEHEDHEATVEWSRGIAGGDDPYQPEQFDPAAVMFSDPKQRLQTLFEG